MDLLNNEQISNLKAKINAVENYKNDFNNLLYIMEKFNNSLTECKLHNIIISDDEKCPFPFDENLSEMLAKMEIYKNEMFQ